MPLEAGSRLAQYRLLAPIGQGGMGVVWRAEDTSLGRSAAIKVLPDPLALDPERLARFEREARLLASLNHPRVASIYGFQAAENIRFLAMEFVEGLDLSERLAQGPIPISEAVSLARQITEALEHAHEKGIIHRDLKPANIKLTAAGEVKVLDFGLAKALEDDPGQSSSSVMLTQSPTITGHLTGANVLLGTAAYMSPEQARGQKADRRVDIWAFGVVLYEMITGRQLFEGPTVSDTLASVLKTELNWSALPAETPPRIRQLLRRCLDRDPKRRLRDIGEARILLDDVLGGAPEAAATGPRSESTNRARMIRFAAVGAGALVVGLAVGALVLKGKPGGTAEVPHRKFALAVPPSGQAPSFPVVSPDGRMVAYQSAGDIWVQDLDSLEPRKLASSTAAVKLFWSPDAGHVGYISGSKIWKVAAQGGDPQLVSDTRESFTGGAGASWLEDGSIVFSRGDSLGLLAVPALGGDPRSIAPADPPEATDFHEPHALPGGVGVVFGVHGRDGVESLALWSKGQRKELLRLPDQWITDPWYSPTGHIMFQRGPNNPGIWALPFSLGRLEATGEAFLVVPEARRGSVAADGTLVYQSGLGSLAQLEWADRAGTTSSKVGIQSTGIRQFSCARDGNRSAVAELDNDNEDVWIYDSSRGTRTRLTFDPGDESFPTWSPSGEFIVHHFAPRGCSLVSCFRVVMRRADGTGGVDTLGAGVGPSFGPDGDVVSFTVPRENGSKWDIALVSVEGDRAPRTFLHGNPRVFDGRISPRGELMAYMSTESGRWEVYLTRFPTGESRWQVSVAGGQAPRWNAKGDKLYFTEGDDIMEVEVSGGAAPTLGTPKKLFSRHTLGSGMFGLTPVFDVTPDGKRFLISRVGDDRSKLPGVNVVQNWISEFSNPGAGPTAKK